MIYLLASNNKDIYMQMIQTISSKVDTVENEEILNDDLEALQI